MSSKVLSLNNESGFNKLVDYYQKNSSKPWYDWLKVKTVFPRPGKQGLVGLMTNKEGDEDEVIYVFKVSQYINYLVQHEFAVMKALNEISDFCPHFCRAVGGIICEVDPTNRKKGNPFEIGSPYIVEKEVLLMEYLHKSSKFYNYIRSDKVNEDIMYSTVKQTLMAIAIAQKKKQFSHYDLHSNNIMMKKCSRDLVFLYVLDENTQFCVATNGCYPVIIDFGFSFVDDMNGGPLWPTLGHTEVGFMSNGFDPIADPKLFLVTVSGEIHDSKHSKRSKKLLNITKNNFSSLPIDWGSGWDKDTEKSASDYVLEALEPFNDESKLFKNYDHYCIDILQTLVILPLEQQEIKNLDVSYIAFLHEFAKIEQEIGTPFYCLYILKGIVDAARTVRVDYSNKGSRKHAVDYFRITIHELIDGVAKYCRPKDIHYERMLCSLLCLAKNIEGILYDVINHRVNIKKKLYKQLPLKTVEELYAVIDLNIEDNYMFNNKTTIMVVDCMNETCTTVVPDETMISTMNSTASISRGNELYRMIENQK